MHIKAVLTGDLINSQTAQDTMAYLNALKSVLKQLNAPFNIKADTFRGDGFQVIPKNPALALHCAIALRAGLIAASPAKERWDARIAIGVGEAETRHQYGEAFVLSGQGLDSMKRSSLAFFCSHEELRARIELPTEFVAAIIDKWTVVEAKTYYVQLLKGLDQQDTAKALKKSRVTVNKALQRAQSRLVDRYLESCETWITQWMDA
jgi:hypothetical protein